MESGSSTGDSPVRSGDAEDGLLVVGSVNARSVGCGLLGRGEEELSVDDPDPDSSEEDGNGLLELTSSVEGTLDDTLSVVGAIRNGSLGGEGLSVVSGLGVEVDDELDVGLSVEDSDNGLLGNGEPDERVSLAAELGGELCGDKVWVGESVDELGTLSECELESAAGQVVWEVPCGGLVGEGPGELIDCCAGISLFFSRSSGLQHTSK